MLHSTYPVGILFGGRSILTGRSGPILSDKCFKCHGPDAKNQKSDFRLDTFDQAIKEHNGFVGLTPGSLEDSEIHWRIHTDDEIELMPPPESKHPLTDEEKTFGSMDHGRW